MKGGKAGRKRRTSSGDAPRQGGGREGAKKGSPKRPAGGAPRKGARKKSYGGTSTSGDE